MTRILLVDLSAVFMLYWHAGANKHAAWPFEQTVGRIRQISAEYDLVVICADGPRCFRKQVDPAYKANRDEKGAGAMAQLAETERALDAHGFHVLKADTFESDDVIATVIAELQPMIRMQEISIRIMTGDKDLMALLEPGVDLLSTHSGKIITAEQVRSHPKIGVDPAKIRDFLVLAGDKSDGAKYFDGIGPTYAAALLNRFGDLQSIMLNLDTPDPNEPKKFAIHPPSVRAALAEGLRKQINGRPLLDVAIEIFSLRTDAPVDVGAIFQPKAKRETRAAEWDESDATTAESAQPSAPVAPSSAPDHAPAAPAEPPPAPASVEPAASRVEIVERPIYTPSTSAAMTAPQRWELALEPPDAASARALAKWAHASNFWPTHGSAEGLFMIILAGRSKGICSFDALNGMHIIDGKPTFGAHLITGMVKASPLCLYLDVVESSVKKAVAVTMRRGSKHEQRREYTIEQAEAKGLLRPTRNGKPSNWVKDPEDMLVKTVQVKLARQVYQDVLGTFLASEEVAEELADAA